MRQERVTKDEMLAVMRQNSVANIEEAEAVVMETDGTLSVIRQSDKNDTSVLQNVKDKISH